MVYLDVDPKKNAQYLSDRDLVEAQVPKEYSEEIRKEYLFRYGIDLPVTDVGKFEGDVEENRKNYTTGSWRRRGPPEWIENPIPTAEFWYDPTIPESGPITGKSAKIIAKEISSLSGGINDIGGGIRFVIDTVDLARVIITLLPMDGLRIKENITMEVWFHNNYPFTAPFARIVAPRFSEHKYIFSGAICSNMFFGEWSPTYRLASIIPQIVSQFHDDFKYQKSSKTHFQFNESIDKFKMIVNNHSSGGDSWKLPYKIGEMKKVYGWV